MINEKEKSEKENNKEVQKQEQSDPGTTHSTDPQENMEGPFSSLMHKIEETFDNKEEEKPDDK
ncbi:hypothetical protein FW778_09430 [Ginsengibacter hankyongi]|uniref:Uncharacterized protein n=1 Tax=Ginsengibacter hankyongi TaxID=2607284 RepID=A0A5J5IQB4_9BACT|nr:hypothetical protein [Ginsengibacter hankyongi]KAA9042214.1 hypothetical protein FW778_09430 [Ginsengibacter hankyongi]